ncbi:hypothetical protein ACHAQJ_007566, partial [Trichoderma viride]
MVVTRKNSKSQAPESAGAGAARPKHEPKTRQEALEAATFYEERAKRNHKLMKHHQDLAAKFEKFRDNDIRDSVLWEKNAE